MPHLRADLRELAEYLASMLDELGKLSRPLRDSKLTSLLSISAEMARRHEAAEETLSRASLLDEILPARHKPHVRAALKLKRPLGAGH